MTVVEAAVETLNAAIGAQRAKADRVELCAHIDEGGTTPTVDLIRLVRSAVDIPLFVLVRPRAGDFVYSSAEIDAMRAAIASAIGRGANGIVTGALTRERSVDTGAMQVLMKAAGKVPVTFHRAFDAVGDPTQALEELVRLGVSRVLTSGGAESASEGAETIAELVAQGGGRIKVVAGGGVRAHNVGELLRVTRASEVHARLVDEASMQELVDAVRALDS